jgi:transposase
MIAAKRILTPLIVICKTEDRVILSLIVLVFLLAAGHNYDALRHFAYESGVAYPLSFATPILIDTFIAAAVWVSLRNRRYGESTRLAWLIVLLFTVASIALNVMHYPWIPGGIAMAILVPIVILLSAELAKGIVESQRNRSGAATATAEMAHKAQQLTAKIEAQTASLAQLEAQKAQAQAQLEAQKAQWLAQFSEQKAQLEAKLTTIKIDLKAQIAEAQARLEQAQNGQIDPIIAESYQIDGLLAAGLTQRQAAEIAGVSEGTLRNRLKNLNGHSLHKRTR